MNGTHFTDKPRPMTWSYNYRTGRGEIKTVFLVPVYKKIHVFLGVTRGDMTDPGVLMKRVKAETANMKGNT